MKTQKIFTGVGSRRTPMLIMTVIFYLSRRLAQEGWGLRSGGAIGADTAFYNGYMDFFNKSIDIYHLNVSIYVPDNNHKAFRLYPNHSVRFDKSSNIDKALEMASTIHPNWEACNAYTKKLHGRNMYQVLGESLNEPSNLYICWAPIVGDSIEGGTRTSYEIAKRNNIKIINLANPNHYTKIINLLGIEESLLKRLSGIHN